MLTTLHLNYLNLIEGTTYRFCQKEEETTEHILYYYERLSPPTSFFIEDMEDMEDMD